jgi:hypothetical protein
MGGIAGEQRLIYVKRTTQHREGRYGIALVKVPHGVAATGIAYIVDGMCAYSKETEIFVPATRYEWRKVQRSGEAASTRTCVNNCTRSVRLGVADPVAQLDRSNEISVCGEGDGAKWGQWNL